MCTIEIKRVSSYPSSKIKKLDVYPSIFPDWLPSLQEDKSISRLYQCYNMVGSTLVHLLKPAWDKIYGIKQKVETKDRLFQFVLNKRLGKEAELPTDVKCHIDTENGKIYTSGKDKTSDTSDDVTLMINPELLNLD